MRTWKMEGPPEIVDGNGHERHDFLFAAAGEPREKTADGLDAVLRIAGDADDRLVDPRNLWRAIRRRLCDNITHGTSNKKVDRDARRAWPRR